jgi:hypothetical protein
MVTWTEEAFSKLGVRTDVPTAGEILAGLSRTQSYELYKAGKFPVPVISVGRRLIVPTAPIRQLLHMGSPEPEDGEIGPASVAAVDTKSPTARK